MKIIDLLNKIANGEEVPKKIRIEGWCYKFEWEDFAGNYIDESKNIDLMSALSCDEEELNREIKIIVEDKKIEELDVALLSQCDNWLRCPTNDVTKQDIELNPYIIENIRENTLYFQRKINELIDEINNLKEK